MATLHADLCDVLDFELEQLKGSDEHEPFPLVKRKRFCLDVGDKLLTRKAEGWVIQKKAEK